ncbi:N-acetyl-gamma-glutamyl-phosphate reductase [Neisseria animalis]|uniref:N-acetyl-gamma-glutamyl-phosphate reductase n=1 Tax=Neisseria animalis TaxID=492 RepID=A0A5P3MPV1_NEIAN|nr:N-acetyl-gamma-glutamyl-phosphate reductase [Neisseria animalis]QEY23592.1 N-acetyl-gamma-glutamyl-phosphate reductase [Neisseria animalis]ROW32737.1 N-acetyl-gamma-glutamyl-phosphate reductase [Neisseria animalis]VEE09292.1 N-acetyl-gamma-glutamyl-phosphate reductase [Neisseria animalis]
MTAKIKAGIVGATGYTGVELLRLLSTHPNVKVTAVTSRSEAGTSVADYFPSLRGIYDLVFQTPDEAALEQCDVVFFATPNGVAMNEAPALLAKGVRIVDLSADFRIKDIAVWEQWYGMKHASPDAVAQAVYGLCEMNREHIAAAQLVANPGCYPTCVSLPLLPLLRAGRLQKGMPLIADCKSGVSGAGRKASVGSLLCEAGDNFKAYGIGGHRHLPEIKQTLSSLQDGIADGFVFVPHLTPMIRGMHATVYLHLEDGTRPDEILREFYRSSPFVDVMNPGSTPETRSVRGANLCRISIQKAAGNENVWIILSVIDNLVKGAAGQAVQNMNIMFGFADNAGLQQAPLLP